MIFPDPKIVTRLPSPGEIANQAIQPKQLYEIKKLSLDFSRGFGHYLHVSLRSTNPNLTMFVNFKFEVGERADSMAVLHIPIKAVARVPSVSKILQLARSLANSTVWFTLLATASAVALLQDRERMYFFLKLICSLLTSLELRGGRKKLALGLWILLGNTFTVYFQANIISSLQALPIDRVRIIPRCEYFSGASGREHRGKMGDQNLFLFAPNDLLYFVRGGILCQDENYISALTDIFLSNISTYEVAFREQQYRFLEVQPQSLWARDRALPQEQQRDPERLLGTQCCLRLAQLLRAHALVRPYGSRRMDMFRLPMQSYMRLRLSPAYGHDDCHEESGTGRKRCVDRSDLRDGARFSSSEDLRLQIGVLAVGWGISLVCALVELVLLCFIRPV